MFSGSHCKYVFKDKCAKIKKEYPIYAFWYPFKCNSSVLFLRVAIAICKINVEGSAKENYFAKRFFICHSR